MDQLPLNSLKVQLIGLLKATQALLGLFCLIGFGGFVLSLKFNFLFGEYAFTFVIISLIITVTTRYAIKGPEADRSQPMLSLTHQDNRVQAHFSNFDFQQDINPQINAICNAVLQRKQLPPPTGIIDGLASDPTAVRDITAAQAQTLQKQDSEIENMDVSREKISQLIASKDYFISTKSKDLPDTEA